MRDPDEGLHYAYGICGGKTRAGGLCRRAGLKNGRCKLHGGMSPKGLKSAQFKHGRYSKALESLANDIDERVNDPKLLDPRRTIAVQEGVLAKMAELAEVGDGREFRDDARRRLREGLDLIRDGSPKEGLEVLNRMQGFLERGAEATRALAAVGGAAERMNQSQSRYWTIAMGAARSLSPEEFVQLLFRIADIVTQEVDKDAAKRILARTDEELCGGSLGLSGGEAPDVP